MTIHYADELVTVHHGDCIEVMRNLPDNSVDSIVTDPPYGLGFMGKDWDDLPPGLDFAVEALRVLKPGGHLLAFGGTRTWHRLAVAVEDAGFEIRDSIAWLYGSGFPKSLDVSKAIDKMDAGAERRARSLEFTEWMRSTGVSSRQLDELTSSFMGSHYLTSREQAIVATADMFDLMRPALPEVPARIEQLVAERTIESQNFAARVTGTRPASGIGGKASLGGHALGATQKITGAPTTAEAEAWQGWGTALKPSFEPIVVGRKPFAGTVAANVLVHGTGALNIDAARTPTTDIIVGSTREHDIRGGQYAGGGRAGEAATFEQDPAGRWPTNVVLDESQAAALDEQSGTLTSGIMREGTRVQSSGGEIYGKRAEFVKSGATYGDSGGASRFFPTFRYEAKAPTSERPSVDGVQHPTVKPLELMRWLVRLVTPKDGLVLEPFAGSGTTIEAALAEGFRCIGIEREAAYLPLIDARIHKPIEQSLFGDWDGAA